MLKYLGYHLSFFPDHNSRTTCQEAKDWKLKEMLDGLNVKDGITDDFVAAFLQAGIVTAAP